MTLSSKQNQDTTVAFFPDIDKINLIVAKAFEQQLNRLLEESKQKLILDFENIRFIDTSGFNVLQKAKNQHQNKTWSIKNANQDIKELFALLNLDNEFSFIEN